MVGDRNLVFHRELLQLVRLPLPLSTLLAHTIVSSEIHGSMVPNPTHSCIDNWIGIMSTLHVCSNTLASLICTEDEAQGWEL